MSSKIALIVVTLLVVAPEDDLDAQQPIGLDDGKTVAPSRLDLHRSGWPGGMVWVPQTTAQPSDGLNLATDPLPKDENRARLRASFIVAGAFAGAVVGLNNAPRHWEDACAATYFGKCNVRTKKPESTPIFLGAAIGGGLAAILWHLATRDYGESERLRIGWSPHAAGEAQSP